MCDDLLTGEGSKTAVALSADKILKTLKDLIDAQTSGDRITGTLTRILDRFREKGVYVCSNRDRIKVDGKLNFFALWPPPLRRLRSNSRSNLSAMNSNSALAVIAR